MLLRARQQGSPGAARYVTALCKRAAKECAAQEVMGPAGTSGRRRARLVKSSQTSAPLLQWRRLLSLCGNEDGDGTFYLYQAV